MGSIPDYDKVIRLMKEELAKNGELLNWLMDWSVPSVDLVKSDANHCHNIFSCNECHNKLIKEIEKCIWRESHAITLNKERTRACGLGGET